MLEASGTVFTGDIQRRTMVYRSPNKWQAQRDVNGPAKTLRA